MRTYTEDYAGWAEDTAQALEAGDFSEIDRLALADEVRSLSKLERRELTAFLCLILTHLLKQRYQPERKTSSWNATIRVQRKHAGQALRESPSLKASLPELFANAYEQARIDAANETGLDLETFPEACPWTLAEVMHN